MGDYLLDASNLLLRWLHVIAAMAWIGESFYFVALDQGLHPNPDAADEVYGESWSVHGGGFYRKQKYLGAPRQLPSQLHWSKWKAYTTWLSGFSLLCGLYLLNPHVYLIDPAVAALSVPVAITTVIAYLLLGWLGYELLCKALSKHPAWMGVALGAWILCLDVLACHLFAGRAAFVLVGAVMASIMSANVFFVIIPGQRRMVRACLQGQPINPVDGMRGKQRSVHNTYLTLPVVFAMLSNHFASTYAHPGQWAILALIMLGGACIRQCFVLYHAGRRAYGLALLGGLLIVAGLFAAAPQQPIQAQPGSPSAVPPVTVPLSLNSSSPPPQIMALLQQRCSACHASHPSMMASAPRGLDFGRPELVQRQRQSIYQQVVVLKIMPLGNITHMTEPERAMLARWYQTSHPVSRASP